METRSLSRKIWIGISTPFQVNYFARLIEKLKNRFEFLITARDHDRIFSMLDAAGLNYIAVGKHGGTEMAGKLEAYADAVKQLAPIIKKEHPDLLLTERWPAAVRVAFGLKIPAWTLYYDEREYHVNRMVFPLSSKVFVPSFYEVAELRSSGVDPSRIVWFRGFHTCYLKGQDMDGNNPLQDMGYEPPIIVARPEPEFATFFQGKKRILEETISILSKMDMEKKPSILVFPRTESQAQTYQKYPVELITDALPQNPVAYADVTLGAAETMLMESFVLGKPAVSTVYWPESKPLTELHKYIPHTTDPKEAASYVLNFLGDQEREDFRRISHEIVALMENPVRKIEEEIQQFYGETRKTKKPLKRRSRFEIYMTILKLLAFRSMKTTHIMQEANLSHTNVKKELSWLENRQLIERINHNGRTYFRATSEGLSTLNDCETIKKRLF